MPWHLGCGFVAKLQSSDWTRQATLQPTDAPKFVAQRGEVKVLRRLRRYESAFNAITRWAVDSAGEVKMSTSSGIDAGGWVRTVCCAGRLRRWAQSRQAIDTADVADWRDISNSAGRQRTASRARAFPDQGDTSTREKKCVQCHAFRNGKGVGRWRDRGEVGRRRDDNDMWSGAMKRDANLWPYARSCYEYTRRAMHMGRAIDARQ